MNAMRLGITRLLPLVIVLASTCPLLAGVATQSGVPTQSQPTAEEYVQRARALVEKGQYDDAIVELGKAIERNEKLADAYLVRGIARRRTRDLEGAEADLNKAVSLDPNLGTAYLQLALLFEGRRESQKAESNYLRAIDLREKANGADSSEVAEAVFFLADLYRILGEYEKAEPPYQRALSIRRRVNGSESLEVASSLTGLGILCYEIGEYPRAEQALREALAIRRAKLSAEAPLLVSSLNELGRVYRAQSVFEKAEPLYREALEIRRRTLKESHPDIAQSLNNLANLYLDKGDFEKAEPMFVEALAIRQKSFDKDDPRVAQSLGNLAGLYQKKGRYELAEPLFERVLEIRRKSPGAQGRELSVAFMNLGSVYQFKGEYEKAESAYLQALQIIERSPIQDLFLAQLLTNLGVLKEFRGDYYAAEPLLQRALEISQKLAPGGLPVGKSLINLGGLYQAIGNYQKAESMFTDALSVLTVVQDSKSTDIAACLSNLADLSLARRDFERAESLNLKALAMREDLVPGSGDVAQSQNNLGVLYKEKRDYAKAEDQFELSLRYWTGVSADHPEAALALDNLADVYEATRRYDRAERFFKDSLAIRERALGRDHPSVAESLSSLAALYRHRGRYRLAVATLARAADVREKGMALVLRGGSEQQKRLYLKAVSSAPSEAVSLNLDVPNDAEAGRVALTTILRHKARALDAMTHHMGALRQRLSPRDQEIFDQLSTRLASLARLQLSSESDGPAGGISLEDRREAVRRLEGEVERLEGEISRSSSEFNSLNQTISIEAVQAKLPVGSALVEIASYSPIDARSHEPSELSYVAYVLKRRGPPRVVRLGTSRAIDARLKRFLVRLRTTTNSLGTDITALHREARALDEEVMRPVRRLLGSTTRLLISADGELNLVPFAALIDERATYLVERYQISYLTSGRDLLTLRSVSEGQGPAAIFANPRFSGTKMEGTQTLDEVSRGSQDYRTVDFAKLDYSPLSGTESEATGLAALLPGANVLTQGLATEAAVKRITRPSLLHIATHGFFLSDQRDAAPANVRELIHTYPEMGLGRGENPLLRSGLILAGVNQRSSGENEDGVLTALEVSSLDLYGTKLVVLSACETGLGAVGHGEGVIGLRRSLVLAGSETQVISLWKVSDRATSSLMLAYYRKLVAGAGRADALRDVQLEMLRRKEHRLPFYWASFIVSGRWEEVDAKSMH